MNVLEIITWLLSIFSSPEDRGPGTILEIAKAQGATTFVQYAQRSNWILNELDNGTDYTALVPTNSAFEALPKIVRTALQHDEVLEWYLRYHLGLSQIRTTDIEDNFLLPTAFKPPQATNFPVQQIRFNIYSIPDDEQEGTTFIGEGEAVAYPTRKVCMVFDNFHYIIEKRSCSPFNSLKERILFFRSGFPHSGFNSFCCDLVY